MSGDDWRSPLVGGAAERVAVISLFNITASKHTCKSFVCIQIINCAEGWAQVGQTITTGRFLPCVDTGDWLP